MTAGWISVASAKASRTAPFAFAPAADVGRGRGCVGADAGDMYQPLNTGLTREPSQAGRSGDVH